jgi:hypothetical protein
MKLYTKKNTIDSTLEVSDSVDFGIDNENEAVIIDILRNKLYSHKIRTLVQEYMSNARDANREIGQTEPILVNFPTSEDPNFWVRDYGPGLSPDRIAKVFVKYGSSTKRNTNTQTGGFGIGAKSAWSYTDSFIIESYFDGVKTVYNAQIADNNLGRLDKIAENPSAEPSGVKVIIGVRQSDVLEFRKSIERACVYWDAHEFPKFINPGGWSERSPEVVAARQRFFGLGFNNLASSVRRQPAGLYGIVVVDGIPFENNIVKILNNGNCNENTIFVPAGLITVSASRENLEDKKENIAVLEMLAKNIREKYDEKSKEIQQISDYDFIMKYDSKVTYEAGVSFKYSGKFINSVGNDPIIDSLPNKSSYARFSFASQSIDILPAAKMDNVYYTLSNDKISHQRKNRFLKHYGWNSTIIQLEFVKVDKRWNNLLGQYERKIELMEAERNEFVKFITSLGAKNFEEFYAKIPKKKRSQVQSKNPSRNGYAFYIPNRKESLRSEDLQDGEVFVLFDNAADCVDFHETGYKCAYTKSEKAYKSLIDSGKNFITAKHFYENVYEPSDAQVYSIDSTDHSFNNMVSLMNGLERRLNLAKDGNTPSDIQKCYEISSKRWSILTNGEKRNVNTGMRDVIFKSKKYEQLKKDEEFLVSVYKKIPLIHTLSQMPLSQETTNDIKEYLFAKLGK